MILWHMADDASQWIFLEGNMMETELTPEEELAIRRVECSAKWDYLTTWLSVLIPFLLISGIGFWNNSMPVVACAGLTFVLLVAGGIPRQIREQAHLKSAIRKLKRHNVSNQAMHANDTAAPLPDR